MILLIASFSVECGNDRDQQLHKQLERLFFDFCWEWHSGLLKRLAKLSLLVIDDFGLAALSELEKQDLLEAIEERYGSGATILTSQLPISGWHEYLGGERRQSRLRQWELLP